MEITESEKIIADADYCNKIAGNTVALYVGDNISVFDGTKTIVASTASPYKFTRSVMDAIDSKYDSWTDFELVDELIDDEVEHMYKEFMQRMAMQGITEEMYYQYTKGKKEDITSQMKDDATKRIKYRYLLEAIIKEENNKIKKILIKLIRLK